MVSKIAKYPPASLKLTRTTTFGRLSPLSLQSYVPRIQFFGQSLTGCSQINIFLWPDLAILLERALYDPPNPLGRTWYGKKKPNPADGATMPPDTAISVQNLGKDFPPALFSGKELVTAVADLSFNIPKNGIFVLLGSNGYEFSSRCPTDRLSFFLIQCWKIYLPVNHWWTAQPYTRSYTV